MTNDKPKPILEITVTRSSGYDGALVVFLDGPFGEHSAGAEKIRVIINDAEVYADVPHGFEDDDPELIARSVTFAVRPIDVGYTCSEGNHPNDDNPGQPMCKTCADSASA